MYTITCGEYPLLDVRDERLMVSNPKISVEVNTTGSGAFTIYKNHPYYDKLEYLKTIFEVADEYGVVFRGRMTSDTLDFYGGKDVELEGILGFFNDTIVRPFNFPDDFLENTAYIEAAENGNVVEFFLKWLIEENHNAQCQDFQKFMLGNVTVSDPNNYITRSDSNYAKRVLHKLQGGAFADRKNAERLLAELHSKGYTDFFIATEEA